MDSRPGGAGLPQAGKWASKQLAWRWRPEKPSRMGFLYGAWVTGKQARSNNLKDAVQDLMEKKGVPIRSSTVGFRRYPARSKEQPNFFRCRGKKKKRASKK